MSKCYISNTFIRNGITCIVINTFTRTLTNNKEVTIVEYLNMDNKTIHVVTEDDYLDMVKDSK